MSQERLLPSTAEDHAATIRAVLVRERTMREKVFQHNPEVKRQKVAEIDRALTALGQLLEIARGQRRGVD